MDSSVIDGASSHSPPTTDPRNIFGDPRDQPTKRSFKRSVPPSPRMRNRLLENHVHSFDMHISAALRISLWVAILNTVKGVFPSARLPQYVAISSTVATQPKNKTLTLLPSVKNLTIPGGYVECQGARYGFDLQRQSCVDALDSLPSDGTLRTFGQRNKGTFDIHLPRRYLSADGLCAIDISNVKMHPYGDSATNAEIRTGVHRLVNQCVLRGSKKQEYKAVGGSIRTLGT